MARLRRNDIHIGQNYVNQYDEGHDIDKISKLPRNLIDDILKRMTIKEVARMSVLSQKWNQIWSTHPFLVLDRRFHEEIDYQNQSSSSVTFDFKNIINKILLQHSGSIVKFVLDISTVGSDWDLHHWLRYVSNNGLKELKIENNSIQSTYTLPSFVFNSGELSRLDITNCNFKMPLTSTSFQNLVRLDLRLISFDPILVFTKLEAPLLSIMVLTYCDGLQYLNISAPRLRGLHIVDSHYVDLIVLKAYPNLKTLTIVTCDKIEQYEFWRRFTLTDIICSFPKLIGLDFNSPFFKFVVPHVIPKRLEAPLENLQLLNLGLCFADEAQISAVICLMQSAPRLHTLKIEEELANVEQSDMDAVREYLSTPNCVEEDLMALRKIKLDGFVNTTNERFFMKLMLAHCPSLVEVTLTPANSIEEREISLFYLEVLQFPQASPNVNILLE